jgi:WD40 repeat protein
VDPIVLAVGEEIARGGMGRVVRAHDRKLGREVAIKEILAPGPDQVRRFDREIRITARLQHPAIVTLYSAGRWPDGRRFLEMRYYAGRPLQEVVRGTRTPDERLALLPRIITVVEALAYAHGQGIIHRDLKPSNVLCGEFGETVVIDWGVAKDLNQPSSDVSVETREPKERDETAAGTVLGTPSYMAPEQAEAHAVDTRADVYALGAMLYHVLAGEPPYVADTARDVIAAVKKGPPPSLAQRAPQAPPELLAIVAHAMARHPNDRYPNAAAMAEDLRRFHTGQLVASHRYTSVQLLGRWLRRHRVLVASSLATLATAAIIGAVAVSRLVRANAETRAQADLVSQKNLQIQAQQQTDHTQYLQSLQLLATQALATGNDEKAAAYLVPVYAEHRDDPGVRFMVARAMASIDPLERTLAGHAGALRGASYSPDGTRIVTASDDHSARIWDAATGALITTLTGHTMAVWSAVYSPDGTRVLTASEDGTLRVWDAATGHQLLQLTPPIKGNFYSAAFSPDGSRIVGAGLPGTVWVWNAATGAVVQSLPTQGHMIWSVAWSPDGTLIGAAMNEGNALLWHATDGSLLGQLKGPGDPFQSIAFSPDSTMVLTASADGQARVYDAASGALIQTLKAGSDSLGAAAFCAGGSLVVTACFDSNLKLWDARSGLPLATLAGSKGPARSAICNPAGTEMVSTGLESVARVWRIPPSARRPVLEANTQAPLESVAFSPDGHRLAAAGADGQTRLFDVAAGTSIATLAPPGPMVFRTAFSPDGARLATVNGIGRDALLWDAKTGASLGAPLTLGAAMWAVAFSPDGARLVTAGGNGLGTLWDSAAQKNLATLRFPADPVIGAVAWSHDGTRLAFGNVDGAVWVVPAGGGTPLATMAPENGQIMDLAFSPDDQSLLSNGGDKVARVFDSKQGTLRLALEGHDSSVTSVAYSPDGALILTGSADGTSRVWSATDGQPLAALDGGQGPVGCARFSPDGTLIATAGGTGTVRLWDAHLETRSPDEIRAQVAERVSYRVDGARLVPADAAPAPAPTSSR